jgi:ADP-ribosylation factor related protein 1
LNIGRLEVGGAKLILWDLGGAPSLRSIWDKYFAEAHVLVCVPKRAKTHGCTRMRIALSCLICVAAC